MPNRSDVTVFTLSGLKGTEKYRIHLFMATFLCYSTIWLVNVTIIATIVMTKSLHQPMYVLLCNLCINGLFGTAGFFPKFLIDLLSTAHVISLAGCLLQGFVIHASVYADLLILGLMSFDRYVAICRPLAYHSVMTRQRVGLLLMFAWLIPLIIIATGSITTFILKLCGSHIPKLYCINYLVNRVACTASIASVIVPSFTYSTSVCLLLCILWSYFNLIGICRQSKENRSKFMQTCVPHLFCLFMFVCSVLFDLLYIRFGSDSLPQGLLNFFAIEFMVVPPILNPLIYGLKLTQVRSRIVTFLCGTQRLKNSHKFIRKKKVFTKINAVC